MGKTAAGAVWLNADRLAPYDYWQFWRNTADADVGRATLHRLPLERAELEALAGAEINAAKAVLADGRRASSTATRASTRSARPRRRYSRARPRRTTRRCRGSRSPRASSTAATRARRRDLSSSRLRQVEGRGAPAHRGGGARVNDEKISDVNARVADAMFVDADGGDAPKRELKLSSGKKKHGIVELVP